MIELNLEQDGTLPELNLNDEGTVILKFRVVGANEYKSMDMDSEDSKTITQYRLECQMMECEKEDKDVSELANEAADSMDEPYVRTHFGPG